jgi:DNA-binding PadR family transcriptional regulator
MEDDPSLIFLDDDGNTQDRCTIYRGHLKLALLRCLTEDEMHGLRMINRIKEVTSGEWAPSPGSVYPMLRELEGKGFISKKQKGRSFIYSLTEQGRAAMGSMYTDLKHQMGFMEWIMKLEQ